MDNGHEAGVEAEGEQAMKTEQIEWFTPKERLPKDQSTNLIVKVGSRVLVGWSYGYGRWFGVHSECDTPDFWAYNPKGPR